MKAAKPATIWPSTRKAGTLYEIALFGVGDDLEDRAPQRLERAALGLLDPSEVLVNVFGGQS